MEIKDLNTTIPIHSPTPFPPSENKPHKKVLKQGNMSTGGVAEQSFLAHTITIPFPLNLAFPGQLTQTPVKDLIFPLMVKHLDNFPISSSC